ncbi:hypothetical protein FAF44_45430 [Nonomuraea sp. MG754425]|uniref:hypothetical protein n=1 Tax=Nonomuraea sp. MG754425 TaxID=2570319 RepID=UPI001F3D6EF0|nr:hypothetical protein [Nonomuraea sp. MG754425]MCF6475547.1 hypothetical protein [Nonomuraea sp. MG754425]
MKWLRTLLCAALTTTAVLSFKVDAMVNRTVTKTTATTSGETQAITWNFTQPGYYGLYQGTRKVTGEYGSINCDNVGDTLRWVERPGGTYTTFTAVEEGVVTCADVVPANSLMKKAQQKLECEGAAPAAEEPEPAPAVSTPKRGIVAPSAVPPGFTCRPGYYRIGTTDGMLFWWQVDASKNFQLRPWWEPGDRGSVLPMWSVCTGPQTNGMTEHVFINREDDRCLSVQPAEQGNDGGQLTEDTCRTIEDLQRFYLYRDVAGSNKVGIQNKQTGFMIGQARIADNEPMRHYSMGSPDAKGTYVLEPVPAW